MAKPIHGDVRRGFDCAALMAMMIGAACAADAVCSSAPCGTDAFLTALLGVANEADPTLVQGRFTAAFGDELARHTRVLVSAPLEVQAPNDVVRFVRLGDEDAPLDLGLPGQCVTLAALESRLKADGWSGGRTAATPRDFWTYRKGRTQLTAHAQTRHADCAASILVTYRRKK
jgi:hypothetical protein